MADEIPNQNPVLPPPAPNSTPDTTLLDRRIKAALDDHGDAHGGGGGHMGGMIRMMGDLPNSKTKFTPLKGRWTGQRLRSQFYALSSLAGSAS